MSQNAGDRALAAATQLNKIGYVEFTTQLVKDTYRVIVEASMDQLKAYADFVSKIAKTLEEYQSDNLGQDEKAQNSTAQSYIKDVLMFKLPEPIVADHQYELNDDQIASMQQHFSGLSVKDSGGKDKNIAEMIGEDKRIRLDELSKFVIEKLKKSTKESYDLIKTILKIGMQKVVVTNGEIRTKLMFSIDATDTYSKISNDYSRKASNWGVNGSVNGRFGGIAGAVSGVMFGNFIGGGISGGYGSNKLNVAVVNEKSTAATNIAIDILGEVKIQFRTETFPPIEE